MGSSYSAEELNYVMEDFDALASVVFIDINDHDGCRSSSSAGHPKLCDAFDFSDQNQDSKISSVEHHQLLVCLRIKCSLEDCATVEAVPSPSTPTLLHSSLLYDF